MTRWGAKETICELRINQMLPPVSLLIPFPFLYIPLSPILGPGLGRGLELRLIKFSRHHWQACCSSSRAINLVQPITVLLLLLSPVLLLLTPYAIHHTLSGKEGGRHMRGGRGGFSKWTLLWKTSTKEREIQ